MAKQTQRTDVQISASILAIKNSPGDKLIEQCGMVLKAGADLIHLDLISSNGRKTCVVEAESEHTGDVFTPKLGHQITEVAGGRRCLDLHIMDEHVNYDYLDSWIAAQPQYVSVHWELSKDKNILKQYLNYICDRGFKAGIALRPDGNFSEVLRFIKENSNLISLVAQSGVMPCLGGQSFDYYVLERIKDLAQLRTEQSLNFKIMVDGGIEPEVSAKRCIEKGANILVAGSCVFGSGLRDYATLTSAIHTLKKQKPLPPTGLFSSIAQEIAAIHKKKAAKTWVKIEAYHGGGKGYVTKQLADGLAALGVPVQIIGLDLSWTDREKRAQWKKEAYALKALSQANSKGEVNDHNYFHPLRQFPEPMHFRRAHADYVVEELNNYVGQLSLKNCYQFNEKGDTNGVVKVNVSENTVFLVEGVYASMLTKKNWDLSIYLKTDFEKALRRAMMRDLVKVFRPESETLQLYTDVYYPAYQEYLCEYQPELSADIVLSNVAQGGDISPSVYSIGSINKPFISLKCSSENCAHNQPNFRLSFCPDCGADLAQEIYGKIDFPTLIDPSMPGIWRYWRLMSVNPENIVSAGEGNTPTIFLKDTSRSLGVNIWAKLEITNPTGTFKDREAAYVMTMSRQFGQDNVVMQSTGNTAMAVTHYAGIAGITAWSFIPARCQYKLLMPRRSKKAHIIAVDGHPIDVKQIAEDFAACYNFPKISPFYERCEANSTQGYEVAETVVNGALPEQGKLGGDGFDYYVQTLSAGMGLIGYYHAIRRIHNWTNGRFKIPRMIAVEISEFSPIHKAYFDGHEQVGEEIATPYFPEGELFEPTLWTTNIRKYYPHLRKMLLDSSGILHSVTPSYVTEVTSRYPIKEEIESHGYRLSDTENSAFIGFSGLVEKVQSGEIKKGSSVILMITGKGLKANFVKEKPDRIIVPSKHSPQDIFLA